MWETDFFTSVLEGSGTELKSTSLSGKSFYPLSFLSGSMCFHLEWRIDLPTYPDPESWNLQTFQVVVIVWFIVKFIQQDLPVKCASAGGMPGGTLKWNQQDSWANHARCDQPQGCRSHTTQEYVISAYALKWAMKDKSLARSPTARLRVS